MALKTQYFVLNPESKDEAFAKASRAAMLEFGNEIHRSDNQLSMDLLKWVERLERAGGGGS